MKSSFLRAAALLILILLSSSVYAEIDTDKTAFTRKPASDLFPNLYGLTDDEDALMQASETDIELSPAIWPFGKKNESGSEVKKPKSTRTAFFLSLLVPGLGEAYVGSKRGFAFIGVEVFSWWMYFNYTGKGFDMEDDFRAFADEHWHYNDNPNTPDYEENTFVNSNGDKQQFNYWTWLDKLYIESDEFGQDDFDKTREYMENLKSSKLDFSYHHYSGKKDQQDYEMIGKYPQFLYGWEDFAQDNPEVIQNDQITFIKGSELRGQITSSYREHYEDMRNDSNKNLKLGQNGIHIMIINRVFSAIDAGRLAYHHNKKLDSELSSVKMRVVHKKIIDNNVPMLTLTKKF